MRFLQDVTLGQYLPLESPVHALDPRAKLVACVLVMAAAFVPGHAEAVAWTWPLLVVAVALSRVPPRYFLLGLRPFRWLFVFTVVLHALTTPGALLFTLPYVALEISREGLWSGALVSAQLATAIAFSALLTLTTSPVDLVWAMERLASPLEKVGVPVSEFAVISLLAVRFFPILQQEAERMLITLRMRGLDPGRGSLRVRLQRLSPLLAALARQVFQRAETLALAMELRGYRPGVRRTSWRARGLGPAEGVALGAVGLTVAAALLGSRYV